MGRSDTLEQVFQQRKPMGTNSDNRREFARRANHA